MNKLNHDVELLKQYNYITVQVDKDLKKRLAIANKVIQDCVSKFDRPEFICPELVEYLRQYK